MADIPDDDHALIDGAAWFLVKGFAIRIHSTDEGVCVDIYKDGAEMGPAIASAYAFDGEAGDE